MPLPEFLRTRRGRLLAWVIGLYACFALLTWWAVPLAVGRVVRTLTKDMPGFEAHIRDARFNPFKLALRVRDFSFSHKQLGQIAAFDEFYVSAQPLDLLRFALGVRDLRFTRPELRTTIAADGKSVLDYLPRPVPAPAGAKEKAVFIPRLIVHRFQISRGALELESRLPAAPQKLTADPVNFRLKNLSTLRNSEGTLSFTATTDHDEDVYWSGKVSVRPAKLEGRVAVRNIDLTRETSGAPALPVEIPSGRADLSAGYEFFYGKGVLIATLTDARAAVRGMFWNLRGARTKPRGPFSIETGPAHVSLRVPVPLAGKYAGLTVNTPVAGSGTVELRANVSQALAGNVTLLVTKLPLTPFSPLMPPPTQMTIDSGTVSLDARFELAPKDRGVSASGSFSADDFRISDSVSRRPLARFARFSADKAQAALKAGTVSVESVSLTRPYLRLFRGAKGVTNVETALGVRFSSAAAGSGAIAAAAPANAYRPAPLRVKLKRLKVEDGNALVQDESVSPAFALSIRKIYAELSDLSTDNRSTAAFTARGLVEAAPFQASGNVRISSAAVWADAKLNALGIDLRAFTPYSVRMLGYKLDRGTLKLELSERLAAKRIESENRFVIDQLELGDKVESPDALKVPVKLGLDILKDRNGVIDLNVPVSGSLDDPGFRLGPLITKTVVDLVEKAALSPFDVLGSILGGGSDLGHVAFDPGSAELDAAAMSGLDKTSQALADRPALLIGVRGAVSRADGDIALRRQLRGREAGPEALAPGEEMKVAALYEKAFGRPAASAAEAREKLAERLAGGADMRALAVARAEAIHKYLAGKGLAPERFFSLEPASAVAGTPAQCELQLDVR